MTPLVRRFPFPFERDQFAYSNNLKPLTPPLGFQVTAEYASEIALKRRLLAEHPDRCYHALPGTRGAQWEVVDLVLHQLAAYYPNHFSLVCNGDQWTFTNHLLEETTAFTFGDPASLPCDPLDFAGRHVQEDLIVMGQRDDDLHLDAGQLCFPGNWSLTFDLGMPFFDIHTPVPVLVSSGLAEKIRRFLLRIEPGQPWTRLNWSLNVGHRLDTAPETFDVWGKMRYQVDEAAVGEQIHLRVEEQNLFRLPGSYALLFTIHTYLMPLAELVVNPVWVEQVYGVLTTLPDEIADYKGLSPYISKVVTYLEGRR